MHPLFSNEVVSLNLDDAPEFADGQRIAISEALLKHLLSYLGSDFSSQIRAGHVGQINVHKYGSKSGDTWTDRHFGVSLQLPVEWTTIQKTPGMTAVIRHKGKPGIFVTQKFLNHLKYVGTDSHEWELVP